MMFFGTKPFFAGSYTIDDSVARVKKQKFSDRLDGAVKKSENGRLAALPRNLKITFDNLEYYLTLNPMNWILAASAGKPPECSRECSQDTARINFYDVLGEHRYKEAVPRHMGGWFGWGRESLEKYAERAIKAAESLAETLRSQGVVLNPTSEQLEQKRRVTLIQQELQSAQSKMQDAIRIQDFKLAEEHKLVVEGIQVRLAEAV